jgi:hypothetical protein
MVLAWVTLMFSFAHAGELPLEHVPPNTFAKAHGAKAADSVNLVVVGTREQIVEAFSQARWKIAAKLGLKSAAREAVDSVGKRSYANAPVSTQYLFHKPQDLAFELEEGNARKRHHVRFWKIPGHENAWAGAACEDVGILVEPTKGLVSHRVSPDIDREREVVVQALTGGCGKPVTKSHLRNAHLSRLNAQGVRVFTDAEVAILSVENCADN